MKLTETQRLAIIGMDAREIGAIHTGIGWVWRSDCFLSTEAAEAVAKALLERKGYPVEPPKARRALPEVDMKREIEALNREIAGLLPDPYEN